MSSVLKILSASQIRQLDQFTIETEPISSLDLMERASHTFAQWFMGVYPNTDRPITIYCGSGNNGGDGLAVARILYQHFYSVTIYLCETSSERSIDCNSNLERLPKDQAIPVYTFQSDIGIEAPKNNPILIDAIFGSGLNRPLSETWAKLVEDLNQFYSEIVAIDIPSGVFADTSSDGPSIKATQTLAFEMPKLAFMFPQNHSSIGEWYYRSIGLSKLYIDKAETTNFYITSDFIAQLFRKRSKYDHKGTFGHALLIAGQYGMMGAAILAAKAILKSGAGLLTIHAPASSVDLLQMSLPEAIVDIGQDDRLFTQVPKLEKYQAIGIGCGLGTAQESKNALLQLLESADLPPLVIDADALNMIAQEKAIHLIPKNSILTPHPKEFERLFGKTSNDFTRHELQKAMATKHQMVLLLKGAHTCIALPNGDCFFNSTGNPGMATAGSGDVLTGMLTGLLSQGYTPRIASILGVYLHGLAGDLAAAAESQEAMLAGDIIRHIGKAFQTIKQSSNQQNIL